VVETSQLVTINALEDCARALGLDILGVTSAMPFYRAERVAKDRLRKGFMGKLPWYTEARINRGTNPRELLPGAVSIISVAVNYLPGTSGREHLTPGRGRLARYARGQDYHRILKDRLRRLVMDLSVNLGREIKFKIYVDDGPMLDREVASRAGLGFYGKNTNVLTSIGSWVFLGQIITNLPLTPNKPSRKSCGACNACIPACPTGAIIAPYTIDSSRCISYLTIENRGPIPKELRHLVSDMVFGCDICQEVCPVNVTLATPTNESAFRVPEEVTGLDLCFLLSLNEEGFQRRFKGSAVRRATRIGLQRNACVVLGNLGDTTAAPALIQALKHDASLVRGHAAWALGRLGGRHLLGPLKEASILEMDPDAKTEMEEAWEVINKGL